MVDTAKSWDPSPVLQWNALIAQQHTKSSIKCTGTEMAKPPDTYYDPNTMQHYKIVTSAGAGAFYAPYIPMGIFERSTKWERVFMWWPHRCDISKKLLWLCDAYRGQEKWGPGVHMVKQRLKPAIKWHSEGDHLIYMLMDGDNAE